MKIITEKVLMAVITGIFGLMTIKYKYKYDKNKSEQAVDKNKQEDGIAVKLTHHPFFVRTSLLKNHIDSTMVLENKGKEAVFRDILYQQLTTFEEVLQVVAQKLDKEELGDYCHIYNIHMEALEEMSVKHKNFFRNSMYTEEEQKVLGIVMKKYNMWNSGKMKRLQENILQICNSPFYNDPKVKGAVILDLYLGVSIDTINDASRTLNTINGDLKGLVFKGKTI